MTDDSRFEAGIGTALREYADGIHPDLDALERSSRTAGARIRRRRRLGGSVAAAAAVAGVVGAASLGGVLASHRATEAPEFATQPTAAPALAAGQRIQLGHGVVATIHACQKTRLGRVACVMNGVSAPVMSSTRTGVGTGFGAVITGPIAKRPSGRLTLVNHLGDRYPGIAIALPEMSGTSTPPAIYHGQDVTIHLAGWKQVGPVGDDKQSLEGPGGAVADIVWRSASDHEEWVTSPDKGNAPGVWVSDVHDGVFVSIQGGQGTTDADIQALGASLTWN